MQLNHGLHAETFIAMPGGANGVRFSANSARLIVSFGAPHGDRVVTIESFDKGPVDLDLPRDGRGRRAKQVKVVRATKDIDGDVSAAIY